MLDIARNVEKFKGKFETKQKKFLDIISDQFKKGDGHKTNWLIRDR